MKEAVLQTPIEVRGSTLTTPSYGVLMPLRWHIERLVALGFDSVEATPLIGSCLHNIEQWTALPDIIPIKSVHVPFNFGYEGPLSLLEKDPLRDKNLDLYNIIFAPYDRATKFIEKLEELIPGIGVVSYPDKRYGKFKNNWIQTHPDVFDDHRTAEQLAEVVFKDEYQGIVWDTAHAIEPTSTGEYPLGKTTEDSLLFLEYLIVNNVLQEVHLQVGREAEGYRGDMGIKALKDTMDNVERNSHGSYLGEIISTVINLNRNIPLTVEIADKSWKHAGFKHSGKQLKLLVQWIKRFDQHIISGSIRNS